MCLVIFLEYFVWDEGWVCVHVKCLVDVLIHEGVHACGRTCMRVNAHDVYLCACIESCVHASNASMHLLEVVMCIMCQKP